MRNVCLYCGTHSAGRGGPLHISAGVDGVVLQKKKDNNKKNFYEFF